ncbi:MAG TPA: ATP-binding cassette domain-containing protein [Bacteroidales bacterium]|nr:ATP-binding cassette domain-containing protein [Bacteroidales bacterium]
MEKDNIIMLEKVPVFQKNILILNNVSLTIAKGEFVYFIGRTGSGKSTLLKLFYADLPVTEGQAFVAGYDLKKIKNKQVPFLRRKLGIVFQDFQLLTDRSVNENLFFAMKATGWKDKKAMQQRAQEVLSNVGLATKGFKMPHQLSGGEQQRVVIARALINNPEIILADEPTGNLDPTISFEILKLLIDINKNGTTVIFATHDYPLIQKYRARTIKFEDGKVSEYNNFNTNETTFL